MSQPDLWVNTQGFRTHTFWDLSVIRELLTDTEAERFKWYILHMYMYPWNYYYYIVNI